MQAARQSLALDRGDASGSESWAALGKSLKVQAVLAGRLRIAAYRLEAMVLDTRTGELLDQPAVSGAQTEVFGLVDVLGALIAEGLESAGSRPGPIAVLGFGNRASEEYVVFSRGLADVVQADLSRNQELTLIDRQQIDKALPHLGLKPGQALSPEEG